MPCSRQRGHHQVVKMRLWENGERGWALKASSKALEFCLVLPIFASGGQLTQVASYHSPCFRVWKYHACEISVNIQAFEAFWLWPLITIQPQFSAFLLSTSRLSWTIGDFLEVFRLSLPPLRALPVPFLSGMPLCLSCLLPMVFRVTYSGKPLPLVLGRHPLLCSNSTPSLALSPLYEYCL